MVAMVMKILKNNACLGVSSRGISDDFEAKKIKFYLFLRRAKKENSCLNYLMNRKNKIKRKKHNAGKYC